MLPGTKRRTDRLLRRGSEAGENRGQNDPTDFIREKGLLGDSPRVQL